MDLLYCRLLSTFYFLLSLFNQITDSTREAAQQHFIDDDCHLAYPDATQSSPSLAKPCQVPGLSRQVEECAVSGVGRFTARSNGAVRAVFDDRTCVDFFDDELERVLAARLGVYEGKSSAGLRASPRGARDLPEGVFRLLLPSGHYECVTGVDPQQHAWY